MSSFKIFGSKRNRVFPERADIDNLKATELTTEFNVVITTTEKSMYPSEVKENKIANGKSLDQEERDHKDIAAKRHQLFEDIINNRDSEYEMSTFKY